MADYIDRGAQAEQLRTIMERYFAQGRVEVAKDYNWAITVLDSAPAADVAPVVRCKDCKYVRNLGFNFGGLRHDSYFCVYNGPVSTGGDDFCSHGELQTNGGGGDDVSD